MIIGYGYRRQVQSFTAYDCEKVYIDRDEKREERNQLLRDGGDLRGGDTLVLLSHSDLGVDWRDRRYVLEALAALGVTVQVRDQEPVLYDTEEKRKAFKDQNGGTRTRKDAGRKPELEVTKETAREFAACWYDRTRTLPFCRSRFEEIFGYAMDDRVQQQVKYRFGPRNGSDKSRVAHLLTDNPMGE